MENYFHIVTMGCQMNDYDSDSLAQSLINLGYSPTKDHKLADVILINTCVVREKAEQKAYSLLGRMSTLKRRKPGLLLGMMGCLAQKEGGELLKRFPALDFVVGPRELHKMGHLIQGRKGDKRERLASTDLDGPPFQLSSCEGYFYGRASGFISIMQGCDNFCSYCIVPYVRGREICRPPEAILEEARTLLSQGVKEIVLLGQNVNSYIWQNGGRWNFVNLLREVGRLEGLFRLRFTTSHPKDLTPELIQCFGEVDKLCPHIHLPFQSGANRVLQAMRRGYTREKYMELVGKLREVRPEIAVSSDVMVGFPGETEQDFTETVDLIRKIEFDWLFSFKYCDRKGTLAESMQRKIDDREKSRRLSILQALQREITLKKNKCLEGCTIEVLVEGHSKKGGQLTGRSKGNKVVNFAGDIKYINNIVRVLIKNAYVNSLWGRLEPRGSCIVSAPTGEAIVKIPSLLEGWFHETG